MFVTYHDGRPTLEDATFCTNRGITCSILSRRSWAVGMGDSSKFAIALVELRHLRGEGCDWARVVDDIVGASKAS